MAKRITKVSQEPQLICDNCKLSEWVTKEFLDWEGKPIMLLVPINNF